MELLDQNVAGTFAVSRESSSVRKRHLPMAFSERIIGQLAESQGGTLRPIDRSNALLYDNRANHIQSGKLKQHRNQEERTDSGEQKRTRCVPALILP